MVRQALPEDSRFLIEPNQSYDGNPLVGDEQVFPQDSAAPHLKGVSLEVAVDWLWRVGKVPEWVNLRAYDADEAVSYILMECCGRFTARSDLLYHRAEGYPPFHVTSPALPSFDWESVEESGRFDLEGSRGKPTP